MNKIKIQKTNRILLGRATIYCSCDIVRECRDHLIRVNQRLAPKKGEQPLLENKLRSLMISKPDHFPSSARAIMGVQ